MVIPCVLIRSVIWFCKLTPRRHTHTLQAFVIAPSVDTYSHECDRKTFTYVNEAREIRTPNLLIWSQTRCRCATAPVAHRSPTHPPEACSCIGFFMCGSGYVSGQVLPCRRPTDMIVHLPFGLGRYLCFVVGLICCCEGWRCLRCSHVQWFALG